MQFKTSISCLIFLTDESRFCIRQIGNLRIDIRIDKYSCYPFTNDVVFFILTFHFKKKAVSSPAERSLYIVTF